MVAESVEISTPGQYDYAINVKRPDSAGVAGLSTTPQLVFKSDAPTVGVGAIELYNHGGYNARISYRYFDANGTLQYTAEEADVLAGQTRTFDPAGKVPLNARFLVKMRAVAGGSNEATEEFIYTGNEAVARYQSGGTTYINRSFVFYGIAAPVDLPQDDVPLASRSTSFGLASDERFSIEGYFTVITANGSTTVNLGGLEGRKANQEGEEGTNATVSRSVFSYIQVADKFIEDYYFEFEVEGVMVKINFYYIIG